jgi:exodeoxyribonuclease VII large subunit
VSGYKVGRGGHAFLLLKDGEAQFEAVVWASSLAALRFPLADGMQVLALVSKVDFYAPHGRLRAHLLRVEPAGTGALYKALEDLRRRLQAEGLFDEARKRRLPGLPRSVGIATASTGAVIHDLLRTLAERFAERRVLLRPCKVQGDGAAADIAAAIDDLNRHATVDVIVVGRGGGSAEDLWCFNDEAVVRAIARSRIPVVAAVGHESDWTLADLVADVRAATPTAAAQLVMPERSALEADLAALRRRLRDALERRVEISRRRLETREAQLGDPRRRVAELGLRADRLVVRAGQALRAQGVRLRTRLARLATGLGRAAPDAAAKRSEMERLGRRLAAAVDRPLARSRGELGEGAARLEALSPLAVLSRGFALAQTGDGAIVRDAAVLSPGDPLDLRFARGRARATVLEVGAAEESTTGAKARPRRTAAG